MHRVDETSTTLQRARLSIILATLGLTSVGTLILSGCSSTSGVDDPQSAAAAAGAAAAGCLVWIDLDGNVVLVAPRGRRCVTHDGSDVVSCIAVVAGDGSMGHRVTYRDGHVAEYDQQGRLAVAFTGPGGTGPSLPGAVSRVLRHGTSRSGYAVADIELVTSGGIRRYRVHSATPYRSSQPTRIYLIVQGLSDATDLYRQVASIGDGWGEAERAAARRVTSSTLPSEIWIGEPDAAEWAFPSELQTSNAVTLVTSAQGRCVSVACGERVVECIETRACDDEEGWKLKFQGGHVKWADRYLNCCEGDVAPLREVLDTAVKALLSTNGIHRQRVEIKHLCLQPTRDPDRPNVLLRLTVDMQRHYRIHMRFASVGVLEPRSIYLEETRLDPGLTFYVRVPAVGDTWNLYRR
jgi:hypothetical protein